MIIVQVECDNPRHSANYSFASPFGSAESEFAYVNRHARKVGYEAFATILDTGTGERIEAPIGRHSRARRVN